MSPRASHPSTPLTAEQKHALRTWAEYHGKPPFPGSTQERVVRLLDEHAEMEQRVAELTKQRDEWRDRAAAEMHRTTSEATQPDAAVPEREEPAIYELKVLREFHDTLQPLEQRAELDMQQQTLWKAAQVARFAAPAVTAPEVEATESEWSQRNAVLEEAAKVCESRAHSLFHDSHDVFAGNEASKCAWAIRMHQRHALPAAPDTSTTTERPND